MKNIKVVIFNCIYLNLIYIFNIITFQTLYNSAGYILIIYFDHYFIIISYNILLNT